MISVSNIEKLNKAVSLIEQSNYIVILTGAGISTPSGIPDFRSKNSGLWIENDPINIASLTSFRSNPTIFYDWFHPLMTAIINASPNSAHFAISQLERKGVIKTIITQNIDLFHQKAGSTNVLELHGSIMKFACNHCSFEVNIESPLIDDYLHNKSIPRCPHCNNALKPSIVFYEEMLPPFIWEEAFIQSQKADLFIAIGTSLEVYPANLLPEAAIKHNAKLIINTISTTQFDYLADVTLNMDVVEVWTYLAERIGQKK